MEVDPDNIPALKCYENNGFVKIKENIINNKNYYLMQLKLKSI